MIPLLFTVLAAAPLEMPASAIDYRDRFEARVYQGARDGKLLYRLLRPRKYDRTVNYPLVLFYHGAGERGDDNVKQLVHGMNEFASDVLMERFPCFVVAPQCPEGEQWVDTPWTADAHVMPQQPTQSLRLSLELIRSLKEEFSIDADRVYLTGLSMGGFGVWDALQRHPELFAAAVPICGGGDPALVARFVHVPIWAFHGDEDTVVKPRRSREMVEALSAAGGSPQHTVYEGVGHNSWSATYSNRAVYDWLFAQRRRRAGRD